MRKGMVIALIAVIAVLFIASSCHRDHGKHKGWFKYDRMIENPER